MPMLARHGVFAVRRRCVMIAADRLSVVTALAVLGVAVVVAAVVSCEHVRSPRLLSSC